ncbi:unnamed protein product [Anisakis simplex]|uniref:Ground-like domain-containing protein n=1 Tax=Anisakis simplex TaxID=6269 RepID=A0A0M3JV81_ANISI|nr:unnamed protein product [Anisakis simplex]
MQMNLQRAFNSSFEAVTGISDFASKIHFFKDYVCKVEVDGRYMLAYGTPGQATPPSPRIVSRPPSAPQIPYQRRSPSVISKQYQVEPAGISYGRQSLM